MKLLVITQSVDINNPILGFFHGWIKEFSKHFESVVVICLEKGEYHLPENVKVLSLGKESGKSKIKYLINFYKYIWRERKHYDAVFVHMNQEYVILGWEIWWILGKNIYMWRNHYAGGFITDLAALFCKKVFCTSKYSYTAKYKKTVFMPVGIDTDLFKPDPSVQKIPNSILSLGRISPSKNIHILIDALSELKKNNIHFAASIYGDAKLKDGKYLEQLKKKVVEYGLEKVVTFYGAVSNSETPRIYNQHEIFVNLSPNGMLDKTMFEAASSCACVVMSNLNLKHEFTEGYCEKVDSHTVYLVLRKLFEDDLRMRCKMTDNQFIRTQDLRILAAKIKTVLN